MPTACALRRRARELELYRGVTHDFIKMGRALKEARAALDAAARPQGDGMKRADFRFWTACACAGPRWTCRRSSSTATT
jgi:hypothetical protein